MPSCSQKAASTRTGCRFLCLVRTLFASIRSARPKLNILDEAPPDRDLERDSCAVGDTFDDILGVRPSLEAFLRLIANTVSLSNSSWPCDTSIRSNKPSGGARLVDSILVSHGHDEFDRDTVSAISLQKASREVRTPKISSDVSPIAHESPSRSVSGGASSRMFSLGHAGRMLAIAFLLL